MEALLTGEKLDDVEKLVDPTKTPHQNKPKQNSNTRNSSQSNVHASQSSYMYASQSNQASKSRSARTITASSPYASTCRPSPT